MINHGWLIDKSRGSPSFHFLVIFSRFFFGGGDAAATALKVSEDDAENKKVGTPRRLPWLRDTQARRHAGTQARSRARARARERGARRHVHARARTGERGKLQLPLTPRGG